MTVSINDKRYYVVTEGEKVNYYPSVTTVIGALSDKQWIEDWHNNIGKEKAEAITTLAVNRGTCMHLYNEIYLNKIDLNPDQRLKETLRESYDKSIKDGFNENEIRIGRNLFYNLYHGNYFKKVKNVLVQEDMLFHPIFGGYAGRVDLIIKNQDDNIIIVDFKTSKKPKKLEDIEGYLLQVSGYWVAYNYKTKLTPEHCEIWISNEQRNEPQLFLVDKQTLKDYFIKFSKMVKRFHKMYDFEVVEYKKSLDLNK